MTLITDELSLPFILKAFAWAFVPVSTLILPAICVLIH